MAHDAPSLRPETVALDALIKAAVQRARESAGRSAPDTLLFMGNWHQAIPALVIQDPVLEPIDKLVWMVVMLQAREAGSRTAFPSYETLASKTNVSSTSTISRAIAILRLTRWLTLCATVRAKSGQFKGNVYVLHDEPLPFVDALHLDPAYMQFLDQSVEHHHGRVRAVARGVLDSLDEGIRAGHDPCQPESSLEQRVQAAQTVSAPLTANNQDSARRYFSFSANVLNQLKNTRSQRTQTPDHRHQNSKAVENADISSGSSYYKLTTTTTRSQNQTNEDAVFQKSPETLIYPARLSDNQKALADRYLAMIEPAARQAVLDELQGRLASEQMGMPPVYDELRFLHALCKAVQQGEFVPNLGIKVTGAREESTTRSPAPERREEPSAQERQRARVSGRKHLVTLKQSLGIKTDD